MADYRARAFEKVESEDRKSHGFRGLGGYTGDSAVRGLGCRGLEGQVKKVEGLVAVGLPGSWNTMVQIKVSGIPALNILIPRPNCLDFAAQWFP